MKSMGISVKGIVKDSGKCMVGGGGIGKNRRGTKRVGGDGVTHAKPSMSDIAAELSISKAAVSMALNGSDKVSEKTKRDVRRVAKRIGYKKNPILASLLSEIKSVGGGKHFGTVALFNANVKRNAFEKYPIFGQYASGAREEARKLGFSVCDFWLNDASLSAERLERILVSRGVRGGLVLGHTSPEVFSGKLGGVLKNLKLVSIGIKVKNSAIDCVCADKFLIAAHATKKVLSLGYRRPMLVLDKAIDDLVEGRFSGGFLHAQLAVSEEDRIPPFLNVRAAEKSPEIFSRYLRKFKPDAVLSISEHTNECMQRMNVRLPDDVALISLEKTSETHDWQGITLNYKTVGAAAMKRLSDYLTSPYADESFSHSTMTVIAPKWSGNVGRGNG